MTASKLILLLCLIGAGVWVYQSRILIPANKRLAREIADSAQYNAAYDPRWDPLIRELAKGYIDGLVSRRRNNPIFVKAKEAVAQGCRDPFVRYLCFMEMNQSGATGRPSEAQAREGMAILDELHQAPYPALLRAYAAIRLLPVWDPAMGDRDQETRDRLCSMLWHGSHQAVRDRSVSELLAYTLATKFRQVYHSNVTFRDKANASIERALREHFGDCATIHYWRGKEAISRAWEARGSGYADTVTPEGWVTFHKELLVAQKELTTAWTISPKDPEIASSMITVCMGLGLPREEMDRWFQRALATGLDASSACGAKSYYLKARWHGSDEEEIAFARECVAHPEYGQSAACELWYIHAERQMYGKLPLTYFAQPEVWADIRASLGTYLEQNPHEIGMHVLYAYHAWLAHDWDTLIEQLPEKLPETCPLTPPVTQDIYDQMVAAAKAHGKDPRQPATSRTVTAADRAPLRAAPVSP